MTALTILGAIAIALVALTVAGFLWLFAVELERADRSEDR